MTDEKTTLADGSPVTSDYRKIDPETGLQKAYVVLADRSDFVRPLRMQYLHVGPIGPNNPLRDLTKLEQERYSSYRYVKFETYPESESTKGRYWTQDELDRVGNFCGGVTTMATAIAETYAKNPRFYSGTYCGKCHRHFAVGVNGEFQWIEDNGKLGPRVGT